MALHKSKDPMGRAIHDYCFKGKAEKLWVYSDISEIDEIPVEYLFRSYNKMPIIEQKALEICVGKVLDVGAASGAHSLYLSKMGLDVEAVDISKLAVEAMDERRVPKTICDDFYKMPSLQKFDTLLFLMNGIGIAGSIQGLPTFFIKCKELLAENGQILLDSSDIAYMFDGEDDKPKGKYYGEVSYIMRYNNVISDKFNWLFIDFETLQLEAKKNGLECVKITDGLHYDYLAKLILT